MSFMQDLYELLGYELFDKVWSSTSFNFEQVSLISEALKSKSKILDLGLGIGNVAKKLVGEGKTVYGLDIKQASLDYVKSKTKPLPIVILSEDPESGIGESDVPLPDVVTPQARPGYKAGNQFLDQIWEDERREKYQEHLKKHEPRIKIKRSGELITVLMDVQNLTYENEFDASSCASNMGHFKNIDAVVNGVHRALQSKGLFVIAGYETEHYMEMLELMKKDVEQAARNGRLKFTTQETEKLQEAQKLVTQDLIELISKLDSSSRTRESLTNNNFKILRDEKFYQDTCYFILAERP